MLGDGGLEPGGCWACGARAEQGGFPQALPSMPGLEGLCGLGSRRLGVQSLPCSALLLWP